MLDHSAPNGIIAVKFDDIYEISIKIQFRDIWRLGGLRNLGSRWIGKIFVERDGDGIIEFSIWGEGQCSSMLIDFRNFSFMPFNFP